jgi:hypothetical protein
LASIVCAAQCSRLCIRSASVRTGVKNVSGRWLRPPHDVTSFHRFSVAAPPSEGPRLTLRPGPVRQANSDYSHYYPRRADGMAGGLLRCISPSCCPRYLPLDQSATIRNPCTYPSRMRPLQTPLEHRTPQHAMSGRDKPPSTRSGIFHRHDLQATSIPLVSPHRR